MIISYNWEMISLHDNSTYFSDRSPPHTFGPSDVGLSVCIFYFPVCEIPYNHTLIYKIPNGLK